MNKKGFTLIELVAVILILGIIALIAIPAVSNVINDSKKHAAEVTAMSYIKSIDDQNALYKLQPDKFTPIQSGNVDDLIVNIKGDGPTSGTVTVTNGKVSEAELCANGYIVTYNGVSTIVEDKCEELGQPRLNGLAKKVYNANTLIEQNPTLTTASSTANDMSGLYALEVTNGHSNNVNGTTYYFRGNVVNNYVSFAEKTWRIIRINEDGTVRLILDESINTTAYRFNTSQSGASNIYYSNSDTTKSTLNTWYDSNIGNNDNYANKIAVGSYFCESAKVLFNSNFSGTNMQIYTNYTPNFKCEVDGNNHGVLDNTYKIGLITYDEVVRAGGYYKWNVGNYYLHKIDSYWTMSPAGTSAGYPYVWDINTAGFVNDINRVYSTSRLRPVINLKANVDATGTGTAQDPYLVQ